MTAEQIHPIDRLIGERMRARREAVKMTQAGLATAIGITFQQVQKYERGVNRCAASRLHDAAIALDTDISYFFAGTPAVDVEQPSAETRRLIRMLDGRSPAQIGALADFAKTLQAA